MISVAIAKMQQNLLEMPISFLTLLISLNSNRVNQHPPAHHLLDACYDSIIDEPQLS
jgi:hypothetical protein